MLSAIYSYFQRSSYVLFASLICHEVCFQVHIVHRKYLESIGKCLNVERGLKDIVSSVFMLLDIFVNKIP